MAGKKLQLGFTIVELLIVIVVIGVLAAIVIVAYNGITNSANEAAVKSELAGVAKKLEVYKATNGLYPANATQLGAADISVNKSNYDEARNNFYYCRTADYTQYAIGVEASGSSNAQYYIENGAIVTTTGMNWGTTCAELDPDGNGGVVVYDWPDDGAGSGWCTCVD